MPHISRKQLIIRGKKATSVPHKALPAVPSYCQWGTSLITNLPQPHSHLTSHHQCPDAGQWLLEEVGDLLMKISKGLLKSKWWTGRLSKVYSDVILPASKMLCWVCYTHHYNTPRQARQSPLYRWSNWLITKCTNLYCEWTENGIDKESIYKGCQRPSPVLLKPDQPGHPLTCTFSFRRSLEEGVQRRSSLVVQILLVPLPRLEYQGPIFTSSWGPGRSDPASDVLANGLPGANKEAVPLPLPKNWYKMVVK